MANLLCTGCDGEEQAVVLITPLSGADTLCVGANCLPLTLTSLLAGELGIDPEQTWDAIAAVYNATAAAGASQPGGGGDHGEGEPPPPTTPAARPKTTRKPRRTAETVRGLAPLSPGLRGEQEAQR